MRLIVHTKILGSFFRRKHDKRDKNITNAYLAGIVMFPGTLIHFDVNDESLRKQSRLQ